MTTASVLWCEECGSKFKDMDAAREHEERNCMPYDKGNRVEFYFMLVKTTGVITSIGDKVKAGENRVINITADEEVYEPDMTHNGRDVFVTMSEIIRIIPKEEAA